MKKLFNILLAVLITIVCVFSLTACSLDDNGPNKKTGLIISKETNGDYVVRDFVYVEGCLVDGKLDIGVVLGQKGIEKAKISAGAFDGDDKIKTLIVSDKIFEIEQGAFRNMKALETLEIPFVGKNAKTDAKFDQTLETEGKATNKARTFSHFFGTAEYEKGRKMNNGYGDVYVPYTLKNVVVNGTQEYNVSYSIGNETITLKEGYAIGYDAFKDARFLQSITLKGANLKEIGERAFSGCTALTSITLPSSIKTVYDSAFSGCINLTSVKFEGTGVVLKDNAFKGCSAMNKFGSIDDETKDKIVNLSCFETIGLYALDFDREVKFKVIDKAVNAFGESTFINIFGDTNAELEN